MTDTSDQEHVTIRTGSRTYAAGILLWRDTEKGTAVVQIGDKIVTGTETKKGQKP